MYMDYIFIIKGIMGWRVFGFKETKKKKKKKIEEENWFRILLFYFFNCLLA